jgi:hypothetical protein
MAQKVKCRAGQCIVVLGVLGAMAAPHPASAEGGTAAVRRFTISEVAAPPGTRTVCLGQRRAGVRAVGCFDVYRVPGDGAFDPTKKAKLRQFVWKYTAEAESPKSRLTSLSSEVSSQAATTYGWNPGASQQLHDAAKLTAAVDLDLLGDRDPSSGALRLSSVQDGWDYMGLPGWIDPQLTNNRFAVTWTAEKGRRPAAGDSPQIAGATLWGTPEPAPDILPSHLKLEAEYR